LSSLVEFRVDLRGVVTENDACRGHLVHNGQNGVRQHRVTQGEPVDPAVLRDERGAPFHRLSGAARMELLPVCSPMARNNCSTSCPDSADVGSSMIRMRASNERAFAMVASCRSPVRSRSTKRSAPRTTPVRASRLRVSRSIRRRSSVPKAVIGSRPDVLRQGKRGNESQFLGDHRHAGTLGVQRPRELDLRTADPDFAPMPADLAEKDLHQGGPGAVLPEQCVDLPRPDRDVDVAHGLDPTEGLADADHFRQRSRNLVHPRPSPAAAQTPWSSSPPSENDFSNNVRVTGVACQEASGGDWSGITGHAQSH
jgi:hypothetical protein